MIPPELAEQLDKLHVSDISEYLGRRIDLDSVEEAMLQLEFKRGRYQRLARFVKSRGTGPPRDENRPLGL